MTIERSAQSPYAALDPENWPNPRAGYSTRLCELWRDIDRSEFYLAARLAHQAIERHLMVEESRKSTMLEF